MSVRDRLIAAADSLLVVIDVQPGFLAKLDDADADRVVERISWLVGVAGILDVPVLVTEEQPEANGATAEAIRERLPSVVRPFVKPIFCLADRPEILAGVAAAGRRTCVLAGLETDVCVTHSALGLLGRGYEVAVVEDASASPGAAHAAGVRRLRDAGVALLSTKGLFYEWVRTVERADAIDPEVVALGVPRGVVL